MASVESELEDGRRELAAERQISAGLEVALLSSRQIGMAMGIVMERYKIPEDRAFDLLRRLSQHLNRKLVDIAHDIVTTRKVPESDLPLQRSTS